MRPTAVVAGGGLAGISTACRLADAGYVVTLLEKRPFLGGRAYSYTDKATGTVVDNGQHVFLGCCTEYIGLLKKLGVRDRAYLQKRLRVPIIDKVWGTSILESWELPPPMHLLPSLLRFRSLSAGEKAAAAWALAHIQITDRARHPELDDMTFADWLREKRQSPRAISSLWNLIVQPTLNDHASRVSADLALMVFQEGFLRSRTGANVGWAKVGLSELIGEAARRYLEARGGEVRVGESVRGVSLEGGRVQALQTDSGDVSADVYVLALPPGPAFDALPGTLREDRLFARLQQFESSPIVNLHLWYDRQVWDRAFAVFLNTPVQWVFNKTRLWRLSEAEGQYLDISLSGAHEWAMLPGQDLIELFEKEMRALFPSARGAELRRALVVKQPNATFSARPGMGGLRPPQRTPVPNLFLAGDWTDTGWPATMESAVRSGVNAADQVFRGSRLNLEKGVQATL